MDLEGVAGAAIISDGVARRVRLGRLGEVITGEAVGRYYEAARQGRIFAASMQAGAAFGTALTATAVTVTLYNPSGSGVNLAILQSTVALTASETTTATGQIVVYAANVNIAAAAPTATTALTVRPALLGSSAGNAGQAYSAATLPATPVVVRVHPWGANLFTTNTNWGPGSVTDYVDGALCLAPNTAVTLQGIATTTGITAIASVVWAEVPV